MKKVFLVSILILVLLTPYSFAQIGGGMISGERMVANLQDMMSQMAGMMHHMAEMMKDMPANKMKMMTEMMEDMSHQMIEISKMIEKGMVSEDDMKRMNDKMIQMRNRMTNMMK